MSVLSSLKPGKVFEYFEKISAIPRGSGHTDEIARFCGGFADAHGLYFCLDSLNNVVIKKTGSPGRESEDPVIIQGHLDMVWEKEPGSDFDFENSGLILETDGKYVSAKGTTLGGDDGVAVAICLALLDSDNVSHPPLEIVFTSDEETGMYGAHALDASLLKSKRMINLDSEAEGILWVSCAGGARADITLETRREENSLPAYEIVISGLHGGHSGTEIDKGYASANILAGQFLRSLAEKHEYFISSIDGGTMDNAITRECRLILCSDDDLSTSVHIFEEEIRNRFRDTDPGITVTAGPALTDSRIVMEDTQRVSDMLSELPHGVIKMSDSVEGLVQTSLNLGIVSTLENGISLEYLVRSNVNEDKSRLLESIGNTARRYGASLSVHSDYSAWEYKKDSPLRETIADLYVKTYGKPMKLEAIHAGLECGIFAEKIPGLDCVSMGPDMIDIHTPGEKLSVESTARVYDFLLKILECI